MPPFQSQDISPDWWWARVEGKRAIAQKMVENRQHCREAWIAAGTAVEFAIKAVIMKQGGFNRWPDKAERPELHTHDLHILLRMVQFDRSHLSRPLQAKLKTALDWERSHDYAIASMERRYARSMVEAVFSDDGVIAWLKTQ